MELSLMLLILTVSSPAMTSHSDCCGVGGRKGPFVIEDQIVVRSMHLTREPLTSNNETGGVFFLCSPSSTQHNAKRGPAEPAVELRTTKYLPQCWEQWCCRRIDTGYLQHKVVLHEKKMWCFLFFVFLS